MVDAGVIVGDNTYAGLMTIASILNQTMPPENLYILQNPHKGKCLTAEAPVELTAMLQRSQTNCMVMYAKNVPMVEARIMLEDKMSNVLLFMSDGDHFYPPDFIRSACDAFLIQPDKIFTGGYVTCEVSSTGLSPSTFDKMTEASDYVSGGTFVYPASLRGLWSRVKEYTPDLGEDRVWRALAYERGFSKLTAYDTEVLHLTTHSSSKYPKGMPAKARAYCDRVLGNKTVQTQEI